MLTLSRAAGCWSCFDQFNRINIKAPSSIAEQFSPRAGHSIQGEHDR
jgi:hypothetical protein